MITNPNTGESIPTVAEVTGRRVRFVSGDEGIVQSAYTTGFEYPGLDVMLDDGRVWVDVDARDVQWLLATPAEAHALLTSEGEIEPTQFDEATLVSRLDAHAENETIAACAVVVRQGFARHALGHTRTGLVEIALGLVAHVLGEHEPAR